MIIKNERPPNYEHIKMFIPNLDKYQPVFAYGETLYNPFDVKITPDIEIHEEVHSKQQALTRQNDFAGLVSNYPEIWWNKYLMDKDFRLQEELEAYSVQYAFVKAKLGQGKLVDWLLDKVSEALSGELYGHLLTYNQARCKIRNYAKQKAKDGR